MRRVENPSDIPAIVEAITDYREQFEHGRVTSNGAASFATKEVWETIAAESESSAKRELLKSSTLLAEMDELTRKAEEAKRLADERAAELNRLYSEHNSLPDKISSTQRELDATNLELKKCDADSIRAEYKRHFRAILDGANADQFSQVFLAAAIVTCDMRKEVLVEKANEREARLVEMRKRSKQLSKQLGTR